MQEIIDAVTRLFLATDDRDWGAVQECFAEEVMFSMAGSNPEIKSPDAISGIWETNLDPVESLHHQVGNFVVKTQGDAAEVFCYGIAYHYIPGNTRVIVGSYDIHLVRMEGEWKIDQFRFNLKFVE